MNTDTDVIATFSASYARIGVTDYETIEAAYDTAPDGATILVRTTLAPQNLTANLSKTVTLVGGYNSDYTSGAGVTTLQCMITVNTGKLTINNFILAQ